MQERSIKEKKGKRHMKNNKKTCLILFKVELVGTIQANKEDKVSNVR